MSRPFKLGRCSSSTDNFLTDEGYEISNKDFISQLPDILLSLIISRLPLKIAVQTCVLSKRWSYIYRFLWALKFNPVEIFLAPEENNVDDHLRRACSTTHYDKHKFLTAVTQYIGLHECPCISSLHLSFCLGAKNAKYIDGWLSFANSRGARRISLNLLCDQKCVKKPKRRYLLTKELFQGASTVANLKSLQLVGCNLGPNLTNQFSSLQILDLHHVHCLKNTSFSHMLSLEVLKLNRCELPEVLSIGSVRHLKVFFLRYCIGVKKIDVCNEELKSYECFSHQRIQSNIGKPPKLTRYDNFLDAPGLHAFFSLPSSRFPNVSTMGICTSSEKWAKCLPRKFTTFQGVERLTLSFKRRAEFDLLKTISLVRAFPCLKYLSFMMYCPEDFEQARPEPSDLVFKHLEKVEITGFYTPNQVEFAIYLLRCAPVLKQLIIQRQVPHHLGDCSHVCGIGVPPEDINGERVCKARQPWNEGERQTLCEQLQEHAKDAVVIVK